MGCTLNKMSACMSLQSPVNDGNYKGIHHRLNRKDIELQIVSSFFNSRHQHEIQQSISVFLPSIEASFICKVIKCYLCDDIDNICYIREIKDFCVCWLLNDITGDRNQYNNSLCSRNKRATIPNNRMHIYMFCRNRDIIPKLRLSNDQNNKQYRYVYIGSEKQKIELEMYANIANGAYHNRYELLDKIFYKTILLCFDVRSESDFEYIKEKRKLLESYCKDKPISYVLYGYSGFVSYQNEQKRFYEYSEKQRCVSSLEAIQFAKECNMPYMETVYKHTNDGSICSDDQYRMLNQMILKQCIYQFFFTNQEVYYDCPKIES
eukprot:107350_1